MAIQTNATITVRATVESPIEKVWELWTKPEHITQWHYASNDWHTPSAQNDLQPRGKFLYRMEAKDGSAGFDFSGTYEKVTPRKRMAYTLDDGRKVEVHFSEEINETHVVVMFDPEDTSSRNQQIDGWQAILNNFKTYVKNQ